MRLMFTSSAALAALIGAGLASPAMAQAAPEEKVNMVIVYGDDPCPAADDGSITVCARKDEGERFRIPAPLRQSASPQNEAWNNKVIAYERVGRTGTLSCSPVGPGGATGCMQQLIDKSYAEKAQSGDVRFSTLIQAERDRRLATVDSEATETQTEVEARERQYEARQGAAQAPAPAATPGQPAGK